MGLLLLSPSFPPFSFFPSIFGPTWCHVQHKDAPLAPLRRHMCVHAREGAIALAYFWCGLKPHMPALFVGFSTPDHLMSPLTTLFGRCLALTDLYSHSLLLLYPPIPLFLLFLSLRMLSERVKPSICLSSTLKTRGSLELDLRSSKL